MTFIDQHDSFFVIPHVEPDGDCIGSALGLASFLERHHKKVFLHNLGPFEKREVRSSSHLFKGRISPEEREQAGKAGVFVLDCSTLDRIGDLALDIAGLPLAVIDHHSSGIEFGDIRFINATAPATSVLVQQVIEESGTKLTEYEAKVLFTAFCTDTGFFRHLEANSAESLHHAARMVAAGASPKATFLEMNSGASLAGRKHLGTMLSRVESYKNGQILLAWELKEETDAIGKANRESDLLYQMLMGIEGVEVVVVLREDQKQFITGGLRSKTRVDVGKIALAFGGGGHVRAAGFGVEGSLDQVKARILDSIESHF